jgi:hypothetical protein
MPASKQNQSIQEVTILTPFTNLICHTFIVTAIAMDSLPHCKHRQACSRSPLRGNVFQDIINSIAPVAVIPAVLQGKSEMR